MSWLNVPHLMQDEEAWCLPACVAIVSAYHQQPLTQVDIATWLGTKSYGTPAFRVNRLEQRGFRVVYETGSLSQIRDWIDQAEPCVLFVRTSELPYWERDTPHAVVVVGLTDDQAYLSDPSFPEFPILVSIGDLMLAWSYSNYSYAVIRAE